jgi:hypothetical protein
MILALVLYGCETWSRTLWEAGVGEQSAEENFWT